MVSTIIKVSIVVLIASLAVALSTVAEAREFAEIYTECGIGAIIAPNTPVVAAITNVTWDLGTTAISSNMTSPETCAGGKAKTAAFIHDSYASLEKDLARGSGEYLDTLMVMAGCDEETRQAFSIALRNDFGSSIATDNYTSQTRFEKAENLYNLVYKQIEGQFSASCSNSNS